MQPLFPVDRPEVVSVGFTGFSKESMVFQDGGEVATVLKPAITVRKFTIK